MQYDWMRKVPTMKRSCSGLGNRSLKWPGFVAKVGSSGSCVCSGSLSANRNTMPCPSS